MIEKNKPILMIQKKILKRHLLKFISKKQTLKSRRLSRKKVKKLSRDEKVKESDDAADEA